MLSVIKNENTRSIPLEVDQYCGIETVYDGYQTTIEIIGSDKNLESRSMWVMRFNSQDLVNQFVDTYDKDNVLCHALLVSKTSVTGNYIKYLYVSKNNVCILVTYKGKIVKKYIWLNAEKALGDLINDISTLDMVLMKEITVAPPEDNIEVY